jgi:hypothetical protein
LEDGRTLSDYSELDDAQPSALFGLATS